MRTTIVFSATERLHLIEDFEQFLKKWTKALQKKRFFEIRYCGRRLLINPQQISYATND